MRRGDRKPTRTGLPEGKDVGIIRDPHKEKSVVRKWYCEIDVGTHANSGAPRGCGAAIVNPTISNPLRSHRELSGFVVVFC